MGPQCNKELVANYNFALEALGDINHFMNDSGFNMNICINYLTSSSMFIFKNKMPKLHSFKVVSQYIEENFRKN